MRLTEITQITDIFEKSQREFLTDRAEIARWLQEVLVAAIDFEVSDEGVVSTKRGLNLARQQLTRLPFRLGTINGNFLLSQNNLSSLEGCPSEVRGIFTCSKNVNLKTLEGCPKIVWGNFYCGDTGVTSLEGISDMINETGGVFSCEASRITSGGIGLMLVPGLGKIHSGAVGTWADIVNKYIGRSDEIYACQAELVEDGWEGNAML